MVKPGRHDDDNYEVTWLRGRRNLPHETLKRIMDEQKTRKCESANTHTCSSSVLKRWSLTSEAASSWSNELSLLNSGYHIRISSKHQKSTRSRNISYSVLIRSPRGMQKYVLSFDNNNFMWYVLPVEIFPSRRLVKPHCHPRKNNDVI